MSDIKLRPYQLDVINALKKCSDTTVVVQPTGTGKTVEFMWHCIDDYHRTLVLVNSEELIDQAIRTAKLIDPHVSIGKFIGKERDLDSRIIVASVQTLKNINNLMLIDRDFTRIIYDEAHRATGPSSLRILFAFGLVDLDTAKHENVMFVKPHFMKGRKLIGFTATPERTDEVPIGKVFKERIDTPNLEWFIEQGYLCDLKFVSVDTGVDMSDVRSYRGDLSEGQMEQRFIESGYTQELSRVINSYAAECNSILIYVPGVEMAKMAAKHICNAGISCDYVIGAERDRREDVIGRFKRGDIRVLVNCLVLKEGFDAPCTDAIILCRPTKSKLLLRQIIGRGTRPAEDKTLCKIVDLVVERREQDIISASGVFDELELDPMEQQSMTIRDKIRVQKEFAEVRGRLAYVANEIRFLKELEEEEEIKKRKEAEEKEHRALNIPDSVSLLLDTRLLRAIGLDAKTFTTHFTKEQEKLDKSGQLNAWIEKETPHDYQIEYLKENTEYGEEDLNMLTPMEAQSFINIMKRQNKATSQGRRHILTNIYKIRPSDIPEKDIDARRLIKYLSNRRLRYGKA